MGLQRAGHFVPLAERSDTHESFEVFGGSTNAAGDPDRGGSCCDAAAAVGMGSDSFDHRSVSVCRGLDDAAMVARLRRIFALYGLQRASARGRGTPRKRDLRKRDEPLSPDELGEAVPPAAAVPLETYAAALEKALGAAASQSPLLLDVALDVRLAALRGRVAHRRRRDGPRLYGLGAPATGLGNALVKSGRPRAALEARVPGGLLFSLVRRRRPRRLELFPRDASFSRPRAIVLPASPRRSADPRPSDPGALRRSRREARGPEVGKDRSPEVGRRGRRAGR